VTDGDQDVEGNVAIQVVGWWRTQTKCQVATSVKLRHAPPVSSLDQSRRRGVIQISEAISYDPSNCVMTFVSGHVESSLSEFLDEWASVRRLVVIARESECFLSQLELDFCCWAYLWFTL